MLLLGLDLATTTGFAFYDTAGSVSDISCGKIRLRNKTPELKAGEWTERLLTLINDRRPDRVIFEAPLRVLPGRIGNPATLGALTGLSCATVALCQCKSIEWRSVPVASWRKSFFGFARKPGVDRKIWKEMAIQNCLVMGIKTSSADAAEAVGIAIYGAQNV